MSTQIQIRRDTTTNWEDANPTLADGEIGFDTVAKRFKVGDGVTPWNELDYTAGGGSDGGDGDSSAEAVAVGEMSNGDMVVVNADGTVSAIGGEEIIGGVTDFNMTSAATGRKDHQVCMDLKNNRVVYALRTNSAATVFVGEIKGDSIEWGADVVAVSERVLGISLSYNPVTEKVVLVYTCNSSAGRPNIKICNVDPDTNESSFGGEVNIIYTNDCVYFSPKPIIDPVTGHMAWLFAFVGKALKSGSVDVSGNDPVILHEATHFNNVQESNTYTLPMAFDPVSNRFLALYVQQGGDYSGTEVVAGSMSASGQVSATLAGHISIFKYDDGRISDRGGKKMVLEYHPPSKSFIAVTHQSGQKSSTEISVKTITIVQIKISPQNGSVEIGEPLVFEGIDEIDYSSLCYYPPAKKLSLHLESKRPSLITQYATIDVVDDVISISNFSDFVEGWNVYQAYDPVTQRIALSAYKTNDGKVYDALQTYDAFIGNLTESNFVGVSKGDYSDGDDATVQISGINSDQQGLVGGEAYYVQPDGSLSKSEGSPSVFAGTAIGPTKLNIKA